MLFTLNKKSAIPTLQIKKGFKNECYVMWVIGSDIPGHFKCAYQFWLKTHS